jgi:hypothetical protein
MAGFIVAATLAGSTSGGKGIVRRRSTTACSAIEPHPSSGLTKYTRPPSFNRPTPSTPGIMGRLPVLV